MSVPERHDPGIGDNAAPRFAIVVATRNRGAKIVALMESVLANDVQNFEMVIIDQSTDETTKHALSPFLKDGRIRYLHSSLVGLSKARNLGISSTSAPIIIITDDDCSVPKHWLSGLGEPFERHAKVGVVFCSVVPVPVDAPGLTPHIIFEGNTIVRDARDVWRSTNALSLGAGMAIRRTMFDAVGGFDELLGAGAKFGSSEDNDLSWRGLLQGWWVYRCADIAVVHDGFRPMSEVRALIIRDMYGIGGAMAKYLRSGRWGIAGMLVRWVLRLGAVQPARDLLAGRRPRGFRQPYMLLRGVVDGLRVPIDPVHLVYEPDSSKAPQGIASKAPDPNSPRGPRYAIVVATRNRGTKIAALMDSILASDISDFEMVIVDQSTNDETRRALAPYLHDNRIRCLHSSFPGAGRARNLGVAATTAPIIAITDDDCIVPRDWLTVLGASFARDPNIGVVFCSVKPVPVDAPGLTPHIIFDDNRQIRDVRDIWWPAKGLFLGAGMAVRRAMFNEVRGFDELMGPGAKFGSAEDNDLSWRGILRGWSTFQCADVAVIHDGFRPVDQVRDLVFRDMHAIGGAYAKYLRIGRWDLVPVLLGMLARVSVIGPVRDLLARRRPRGFSQSFMLLRGVFDGLRLSLDRTHLAYRLDSSAAPRADGITQVSLRPPAASRDMTRAGP